MQFILHLLRLSAPCCSKSRRRRRRRAASGHPSSASHTSFPSRRCCLKSACCECLNALPLLLRCIKVLVCTMLQHWLDAMQCQMRKDGLPPAAPVLPAATTLTCPRRQAATTWLSGCSACGPWPMCLATREHTAARGRLCGWHELLVPPSCHFCPTCCTRVLAHPLAILPNKPKENRFSPLQSRPPQAL